MTGEPAAESHNAGLIGNADQRAADGAHGMISLTDATDPSHRDAA